MGQIEIKNSIIFVTGANRGIGRAFVHKALERGAAKVYASARNIETLTEVVKLDKKRVVAIALDVTQPEEVEAAALKAQDVQILINNAGVANRTTFMQPYDLTEAYHEMEVNYFGALRMARAFAPILKKNGGGTLVNISSVASHVNFPGFASYSASKAAAHSMTQGLRAELALQETYVAGVYPGPVDTDMAKDLPFDKESPENVAANVYDALEKGVEDIFPDPFAVQFSTAIKKDAKAVEKQNAVSVTTTQD